MATIQDQSSRWSRIMGTVGFKKTYNFILWFIVSGALLGFLLARSPYLDFNVFCHSGPGSELGASPGECYYYVNFDRYYIGIRMHLISITTASFLAILQFVPIIRYKALLFHRISGYLVFLGILFAHIGSLMIANIAFGGGVAVTTWIGILALCTTIFVVLAWINIKRLQIDQHRAWMLRAWFYVSETLRSAVAQFALSMLYHENTSLTFDLSVICHRHATYSAGHDGRSPDWTWLLLRDALRQDRVHLPQLRTTECSCPVSWMCRLFRRY